MEYRAKVYEGQLERKNDAIHNIDKKYTIIWCRNMGMARVWRSRESTKEIC